MARILKHTVIAVIAATLIVLTIVYPYLPGEYDMLAAPVSFIVQFSGFAGLPLAVVGVLWLLMPKRGFAMAILSMIFGTVVILFMALIATLSIGKISGILVLLVWGAFTLLLIPRIRNLKDSPVLFSVAPLYLVALPVLTVVSQLILAGPVTERSRNRAIAMAEQYIEDIERYHTSHGNYPITLHAQHKDYQTGVTGVEKYHYAPQGDGYNLSFEQPKFISDRFGAREWVVYNPLDQQRMYSHVTWLMPSAGSAGSQGWFATGETPHAHWKLFYFD